MRSENGVEVHPFRILHVDDDPEMRDIVELSLCLDPAFEVMSCASGAEALVIAAERAPDLILCDVMMRGMDGPAMLARLREGAKTARIAVVFLTGRGQPCEVERLRLLGAVVITKPFDAGKLAEVVRRHLRLVKLTADGYDFIPRLRRDAAALAGFQENLRGDADPSAVLEDLQSCAHKLAGAAGVFNFPTVSAAASALEEAVIERRTGRGPPGTVEGSVDALLECIGRE